MIGLAILMLVPLAIAAALYSVLAVWAALGRGHWYLRGAVVCAGLSLLIPIRAYEPLAVFLVSTPAIVVASLLIRRFFSWTARSGSFWCVPPVRFRLPSVLFATGLTAGYLGLFVASQRSLAATELLHAGPPAILLAIVVSLSLALVLSRGLWRAFISFFLVLGSLVIGALLV
jgi:hypothetical protein